MTIRPLMTIARSRREHGGEGIRFAAGHHGQQGFALIVARAFIDDRQTFALALMHRAWPPEDERNLSAVERDIAEMALIDRDGAGGLAAAVSSANR